MVTVFTNACQTQSSVLCTHLLISSLCCVSVSLCASLCASFPVSPSMFLFLTHKQAVRKSAINYGLGTLYNKVWALSCPVELRCTPERLAFPLTARVFPIVWPTINVYIIKDGLPQQCSYSSGLPAAVDQAAQETPAGRLHTLSTFAAGSCPRKEATWCLTPPPAFAVFCRAISICGCLCHH